MAVVAGLAPFVGRADELAALADVIAAPAVSGAGAAVLVRGPAGRGKTRLVEQALGGSTPAGTILRATASPLESETPLALATSLVRRLDTDAASAGACAEAIERLAIDDGPVMVAADDLQWADDASLLVLEKLVHLARDLPIALVCLARPAPVPAGLLRLERALEHAPRAIRIEVDPLGEDELVELAERMLGARPPAELLDVMSAAGGSPLFVTELLRGLQARDSEAADSDAAVPTIAAAILRHLQALGDDAVALLRTAATLGTRFSINHLCAVSGHDPREVTRRLAPAVEFAILLDDDEGLRFAHDLIRDTLYEEEPPAARRSRHRDVVAALDAAGVPVDELAGHLDLADLDNVPEAVDLLRRAAATELPIPAERRVRWLERARDLSADPPAAGLLMQLGTAYDVAGRDAESLATHQRLAGRFGELTAWERGELLASSWLTSVLGPEDSRRIVDDLLAPGSDAFLDAQVEWMDAVGVLDFDEDELTPDRQRLGRAYERLVAADLRTEHPGATCFHALNGILLGLLPVEPHLRQAFETARMCREPERFIQTALEASITGRLPPADVAHALEEALDLAVHLGSSWEPWVRVVALAVEAETGDWEAVRTGWQSALEALGEDPQRNWLWSTYGKACDLVIVLRELGEAAAARQAAEGVSQIVAAVARDAASGGRDDWAVKLTGLDHFNWAVLALGEGDTQTALDHLRAMRAETTAHDGFATAALAHDAGDRDLAREIADNHEQSAERLDLPVRTASARLARAVAERDPSLLPDELPWDNPFVEDRHLDELVADLHVDRGADGDRDAAKERYLRALRFFEEREAEFAVRRVRAKLRGIGVSRTGRRRTTTTDHGWDAITDSEWATLDLVEQGLLYREIAERRFVSRRTVETHVANASRKLGVNNRRDLTALFRESDGAARLRRHRAR